MRQTYDALRCDVGRRPWPDAVVTTPSSVQVDEYTLVRRDEPFMTATPGRIVLHRHETAGLGRAVPINYYLRDGITVQVGDRTGDPYHLRVRGAGAMRWDPRIGSVVITENEEAEVLPVQGDIDPQGLFVARTPGERDSLWLENKDRPEHPAFVMAKPYVQPMRSVWKVLTKVVPVRHVPADEPVTGEEEATSDGQDPLLSGEAAETHSKPDSEEKVIGPEHALLADDQPRRVWIDRLERDEALARRDAVQALMKEWERSAAPPHEQRPPAC